MSGFFPILKLKLEKIPTNWKKIRQIGKNPDKLEKKPQIGKKAAIAERDPSGCNQDIF